ncbi:MAG: CPBP family intramembrane glutamic endopeptidase [Promethearchaeia archaeon]
MNLGANPWILIGLIFLEFFFIIIPPLISARIEKRTFREEFKNMGLEFTQNPPLINIKRISLGLVGGIIFFLIGRYIAFFFRTFIVEQLLGAEYVATAKENAIQTSPVSPNVVQIVILILLQVLVVAVCEEAFFRGFLISKLEYKVSPRSAVVLSSVIFAFYHVPPFLVPISTILTFFGYYITFGILLSLLFKFSDDSLLSCIVAHSFFNSLLILI